MPLAFLWGCLLMAVSGFGDDFFDEVLGSAQTQLGGFVQSTPGFQHLMPALLPNEGASPFGGGQSGGMNLGAMFGGLLSPLENYDWRGLREAGDQTLKARQAPAASTSAATAATPSGHEGHDHGATGGSSAYGGADEAASKLGPAARRVSQRTGVPASVILAIAANEAGGDLRSNLARTQNNPFGIKDSKDPSGWARFGSYDEAVEFFGTLMQNDRYRGALARANDANAYIRAIADAGYIQPDQKEAWIAQVGRLAQGYAGAPPPVIAPSAPSSLSPSPTPTSGSIPAGEAYSVSFAYNKPYGGGGVRGDSGSIMTHHNGVDLVRKDLPNNGRGSDVTPFVAGTVKYVGRAGVAGNYVVLDDGQGNEHWYMHLDGTKVRQGQQVGPGTSLGVLGGTGTEEFPHLHYEIRDRNQKRIDPTPYIRMAR